MKTWTTFLAATASLAAAGSAAAFPAALVAASLANPPMIWGGAPNQTGWRSVTLSTSLSSPMAIDFLPDGQAIVVGKWGGVWLANPSTGALTSLGSFPAGDLFTGGQGGLLDVSVHPQFAVNGRLYFTYSQGSNDRNRTALARAELRENMLMGFTQLFGASQWKAGGQHFGSRLAWMPDGSLLMSVADGGNPTTPIDGMEARLWAQRGSSHLGKILRLNDDGRAAAGNPFASFAWARPEIWSFGHRNPQGVAVDPANGRVYATEHGPQGGDELNVISRGQNYGWPRATHGREYWGDPISPHTALPGMISPRAVWTPAIAPSGMLVYRAPHFPQWTGDLLATGMQAQGIRRVDVNANGWPIAQWHIQIGQRVRDLAIGPDGHIYIVTDPGHLIRIEPVLP